MYPYNLPNFTPICGSTLSNIRPRLENAARELILSARCFAGDNKKLFIIIITIIINSIILGPTKRTWVAATEHELKTDQASLNYPNIWSCILCNIKSNWQ
jgi:hypothetical protein